MKDYVASLRRHNFKKIIIIPSHGGNFGPVAEVAKELDDMTPAKVYVYSDLQEFVSIMMKTSPELGISLEEAGAHAGEAEASMMMYVCPRGVRETHISDARGFIGVFDEKVAAKIFKEGIRGLSPIGVLGDPKQASKEHGKKYIEDLVEAIVQSIKE